MRNSNLILGIVMGIMMISCKGIIHKIKTGDHLHGKESPIDAVRIEKLKPGLTSEKEFKAIFGNKLKMQLTFPKGRVREKEYNGRLYSVQKILGVFYAPDFEPDEEREFGLTWRERIYLAAFFSEGVLQFFTVSHETHDAKGNVSRGSMDTGIDFGEYWPGNVCDMIAYQYLCLGKETSPEDLQDCGIEVE